MSEQKRPRDFYSGIPWVSVTPEQARAHPKGKPGVILWIIAIYFLFVGGWKFWFALDLGAGFGIAVLNGIWPFLAGVGLLMRVPWSVFMAIVSAAVTIWALLRSTRATATLYNSAEQFTNVGMTGLFGIETYGDAFFLVLLVEMILHVFILFHLMDGDRPNLIYRHRYRKYSVDQGD